MNFVLQVIGWVVFIYGFFSLVQDIILEATCKKLNHNMKIIVFAKDLENNLENFSRELADIKRKNGYKNITLIDMEKNDNIHNIVDKLEENEINLRVLGREEGEKYIYNFFKA